MNDQEKLTSEISSLSKSIDELCKDISNLIEEVKTTTRYLLIAVCAIAVGKELVQALVTFIR